MKYYQLNYLISLELLEDEVNFLQEKIISQIQEGGILVDSEKPIIKNLERPIKKNDRAYFSNLKFQLAQEKLLELENKLKSESKILRFLILTQKRRRVEAPRRKMKISEPKVELEKIEEKLKEILKE